MKYEAIAVFPTPIVIEDKKISDLKSYLKKYLTIIVGSSLSNLVILMHYVHETDNVKSLYVSFEADVQVMDSKSVDATIEVGIKTYLRTDVYLKSFIFTDEDLVVIKPGQKFKIWLSIDGFVSKEKLDEFIDKWKEKIILFLNKSIIYLYHKIDDTGNTVEVVFMAKTKIVLPKEIDGDLIEKLKTEVISGFSGSIPIWIQIIITLAFAIFAVITINKMIIVPFTEESSPLPTVFLTIAAIVGFILVFYLLGGGGSVTES